MNPRTLLRVEGLTTFLAATAAYVALSGSPWLYLLLALAPDLSVLGYLAGPRVGSYVYDAAHTYPVPAALIGLGVWTATPLVTSVGLVWVAHVGADRAVGYGLKYPTEFGDTHLGRLAGSRSADANPAPGPDTDPSGAALATDR
jgi:hypothetical protein